MFQSLSLTFKQNRFASFVSINEQKSIAVKLFYRSDLQWNFVSVARQQRLMYTLRSLTSEDKTHAYKLSKHELTACSRTKAFIFPYFIHLFVSTWENGMSWIEKKSSELITSLLILEPKNCKSSIWKRCTHCTIISHVSSNLINEAFKKEFLY